MPLHDEWQALPLGAQSSAPRVALAAFADRPSRECSWRKVAARVWTVVTPMRLLLSTLNLRGPAAGSGSQSELSFQIGGREHKSELRACSLISTKVTKTKLSLVWYPRCHAHERAVASWPLFMATDIRC
jgi:hypothetical protein